MSTVQWVGGPEDGKTFEVKDGINHIVIPFIERANFLNDTEVGPTDFISTRSVIVPIKLTRNGYRAYWPYDKM